MCWTQKDCTLCLSSYVSSSHTQIRVFVCICRETWKQARTSICIFLFIFIPVTHQYAVSFCPVPFSDCLFALSLSSRLTPTLDQQHPVSLFIKCLFLQSAGFPFTEMSSLPFPVHAKVYSYASYYPHTVPSLVFRLRKRPLANLDHHIAPSPIGLIGIQLPY